MYLDSLHGVASSPPSAASEKSAAPQRKPPRSFWYRMSMTVSRSILGFFGLTLGTSPRNMAGEGSCTEMTGRKASWGRSASWSCSLDGLRMLGIRLSSVRLVSGESCVRSSSVAASSPRCCNNSAFVDDLLTSAVSSAVSLGLWRPCVRDAEPSWSTRPISWS